MMLGRASAAARRRASGGTVRVAATELPLRRVYQRATASAVVPLTGTYTGTASDVSARIIRSSDSAEVVGWTTVATTSGGSSSAKPVAWWMFEEASGNRASSAGALDVLVPSASAPTKVAGPSGLNAVNFVKASTQQFSLDQSGMSATFPGHSAIASNSMTVAAWVRIDAETGTDGGILSKETNFQFSIEGNAVQFRVHSPTDQVVFSSDAQPYTAGTWRHYVGRYTQSTGEVAIFANGVKQTTATIASRKVSTGPFLLGASPFKPNFDGALAEVFVCNSALTDSQITSVYTSGLAGSGLLSAMSLGTWSGGLTVPQGGWYKIQYRLAADQAAIFTGSNIFGVGDVWAFAGEAQQARLSTLISGSPVPDDRTGYFNGPSGWGLPGSLAGTGGNGIVRFLNLMVTTTNVPQACVQVSVEGTAITDWESSDPAYTTAVSRLTSVGAIAGFLWHQGGTGIGALTRDDYKSRLSTLFAGIGQAATVQRFGLFPLMHRTNAANTDIDTQEIRKAHYEYLSANPQVINLGWLPDVALADDVSQTAVGSESIAFTYAHALLYQMGAVAANNLGPTITGASRSGTTVTLTVQHRSGSLLRTRNGLQATGFQVLPRGTSHSDAAAISITGVTLAASTITLTLATDPAGAVDVYYQWGRFDNTAPVFDNAQALGSTDGNALQPLMAPVQTPVESGQFLNPALKLDGETGHLRYSDGVLWDLPDGNWTFGMWVKLDSNAGTASQYLFSNGAYGANNTYNFIVYESESTTPNRFELIIRGAGTSAIVMQGPVDMVAVDTAWRLWIVEFVKATDTINIYYCNVNGAPVLYKSQSAAGLGAVQPVTGAAIGVRSPPVIGSQRWVNGSVWSFFKMNSNLTQPEIQSVGGGIDPPLAQILTKANTLTSPIANSGVAGSAPAVITGTVVLTEGPKFSISTTAIQFDESGLMTYTMPKSASHNLPDANWTLGFFASVSDNQGANGQYFWSTGGGLSPNSINIFLWEVSSANPNAFGVSMEGSSAIDHDIISPSVASLLNGTWRLWTVERNGSMISIHQTPVNGTRQLVHQYTLATALGSITPTVPTVTIGGRYAGATPVSRYFGGRLYSAFQMDNVIAASTAEAIARGKDPITDLGLSLKWFHRFTDTTSPRTDLSGNGNTATRTAGIPVQVAGPVFIPNA